MTSHVPVHKPLALPSLLLILALSLFPPTASPFPLRHSLRRADPHDDPKVPPTMNITNVTGLPPPLPPSPASTTTTTSITHSNTTTVSNATSVTTAGRDGREDKDDYFYAFKQANTRGGYGGGYGGGGGGGEEGGRGRGYGTGGGGRFNVTAPAGTPNVTHTGTRPHPASVLRLRVMNNNTWVEDGAGLYEQYDFCIYNSGPADVCKVTMHLSMPGAVGNTTRYTVARHFNADVRDVTTLRNGRPGVDFFLPPSQTVHVNETVGLGFILQFKVAPNSTSAVNATEAGWRHMGGHARVVSACYCDMC